MIRWIKFNAVGLMGVAVQLAALAVWTRLGVHYLVATALAVETAVLHNYAWHVRWTWKERPQGRGSLCRFQLSNGALSLALNLVLMRVLTGWAGLPAVPANLVSIACASLFNFWISERWVFANSRGGVSAASEPVLPTKFEFRSGS